ncbi:FkbM family methyltransferase, partial [Porcipelethomonas sp.]
KYIESKSVDNMLDGKEATLIKMDVEGAEREALWGACQTISKYSPRLMVALYHRNEDIFELPLLVHKLNPKYKLYIRHQLYIPAWETNLYAII